MTTKSKDFLAGRRAGRTFVAVLFGILLSLGVGLKYFFFRINREFDKIWMEEKGTAPEKYMYVVLWIGLIIAPYILVQILKLLLPDPVLEVIDKVLAWIVTIALFAAVITGASMLKKKS